MKLDKILKQSKRLEINNNSKLVIMSDCHRGAGDNDDNFIKNQNIFESALNYYYNNNFVYIELGDGDEMWEVKNYKEIITEHLNVFKLLKKFNNSNRLLMIYGNHDIVKKKPKILRRYFNHYYNEITKQKEPLLNNLKVYESIVLNYNNYEIFLIHGHQVDFLNSNLWKVSRFLVRYIWKYLELLGMKDPTSAAKNYKVSSKIEKKLKNWSIKNNKILIAGHTHRPIYPKIGESLYFNDGSCIHPNGITCIEIENGKITLVKWNFLVNEENLLTIGRSIMKGEISITDFFNQEILKK